MNNAIQSLAVSLQDSRNFNPMGFNRMKPSPTTLSNYISPIQFMRLASDIKDWRDAMREMELAYFPHRVKAMRIYIDTVENVFIKALLERWKELTLQRDFCFYQIKGGKKVISKDLSQQIAEQYWFHDYLEIVLETILWGYSLIELGNLDESNGLFPELSFTRRENIRIDNFYGGLLTSIPYMIDGIKVQYDDDKLVGMCNHWIDTKSNRGSSKVGYGLLYNISQYEIHLRHIMEWNVDYVEAYGQPTRVGYTNKQGTQRKRFENFLANTSANQYILLDLGTEDKIEFQNSGSSGNGTSWKSYADTEKRLESKLCQLVLGHADAIISMPGKLGGAQSANKDGFNESLIEQAMNSKQIRCGNYSTRKVNEVSIPKFRQLAKYTGSKVLGNLFPIGYYFGLENDKEDQELSRRVNSQRKSAAEVIQVMFNSGWKVNKEQIEDWTGLQITEQEIKKELDEYRKSDTTIEKKDPDDPAPKEEKTIKNP